MKKNILLTILILSIWLTGCSLIQQEEKIPEQENNQNSSLIEGIEEDKPLIFKNETNNEEVSDQNPKEEKIIEKEDEEQDGEERDEERNEDRKKEYSENFREEYDSPLVYKPIIYLYPDSEQEITVTLPIEGEFLVTYPQISPENERKVLAKPDGTLINKADNREYSYLFREANLNTKRAPDEGFVVKNEDTVSFLQEKLAYLGLTPREYNEFIVYWWPLMMKNSWNQISFLEEEYSDFAPLEISPSPDSIQRVFMTFKGLEAPIKMKEQKLKPFTRTGFFVIERGGTELK